MQKYQQDTKNHLKIDGQIQIFNEHILTLSTEQNDKNDFQEFTNNNYLQP